MFKDFVTRDRRLGKKNLINELKDLKYWLARKGKRPTIDEALNELNLKDDDFDWEHDRNCEFENDNK